MCQPAAWHHSLAAQRRCCTICVVNGRPSWCLRLELVPCPHGPRPRGNRNGAAKSRFEPPLRTCRRALPGPIRAPRVPFESPCGVRPRDAGCVVSACMLAPVHLAQAVHLGRLEQWCTSSCQHQRTTRTRTQSSRTASQPYYRGYVEILALVVERNIVHGAGSSPRVLRSQGRPPGFPAPQPRKACQSASNS